MNNKCNKVIEITKTKKLRKKCYAPQINLTL